MAQFNNVKKVKSASKDSLQKIISILYNSANSSDETMQKVIDIAHSHQAYTDQEIYDMFNLSGDEIVEMTKLINDSKVSPNTLYSSAKIVASINEALIAANSYTDSLLSNMSSISLEFVTTLPQVGYSNIIYVLEVFDGTTTKHSINIYKQSDGQWVEVGFLDVDVSNFYTKTEVDTLLQSKANTDEVLLNSDIVTTLFQSVTDTQVPSASIVKNELANKLDITAVTDTIDENSTHSQIPTAECVYDLTKDHNIKTFSSARELGLSFPVTVKDIFLALPDNSLFETGNHTDEEYNGTMFDVISDLPTLDSSINAFLSIRKHSSYRFDIQVVQSSADSAKNIRYIGQLIGSNGDGIIWDRVCTTKALDVDKTPITLSNTTNYSFSDGESQSQTYYEVKNGRCYVHFIITCVQPASVTDTNYICSTLPKPREQYNHGFGAEIGTGSGETIVASVVNVNDNGCLLFRHGVIGHSYVGSFDYAVAEN